MRLTTIHHTARGQYALYQADFPDELFDGFCVAAIEYQEYGSLDDIISSIKKLLLPDDASRLFALERSSATQYGLMVIRGAEHLNEYLKKEVPSCCGSINTIRYVLAHIPAPGVETSEIPYSFSGIDEKYCEDREREIHRDA